MSDTRTQVRKQAVGTALVNVVLNPLIEGILNRTRGFQPSWGAHGVVVNLALTSVILSVLVALFAARGVRRERAAGRMWAGLLLGTASAVAVAVVFWLLDLVGVSGVPFWGLLLLKAGYGGALAYVVARWTVVRSW